MGQVNCRKHYLSLRKSLVLYIIAFVVLAVFLSVTTFSICGSAAEGIRASYPPSGEKYYLTNEQGEQLGDGSYIGTVPVPMSKEDERTIALLEKLPIVATPIYSAFCIIAAALLFYRNRLKKPLAELRTASEKIANNDLDFSISTMITTMNWDSFARLLKSCGQPLRTISLKCGGKLKNEKHSTPLLLTICVPP